MQNSELIRKVPGYGMRLAAICLTAGVSMAMPVLAAGNSALSPLSETNAVAVAPVAANDDAVALLVGLIRIEHDMILGQLFLRDGAPSSGASHFMNSRQQGYPMVKDGLAALGALDLEPLLIKLEAAGSKEEVAAAYVEVVSAIEASKMLLQPSGEDILAAVILTAEEAGAKLDPSGTTGVAAYQESWGLLMAARSQLDALMIGDDFAKKKIATKMALEFDSIILELPDPKASAPVAIDPSVVEAFIGVLKNEVLAA